MKLRHCLILIQFAVSFQAFGERVANTASATSTASLVIAKPNEPAVGQFKQCVLVEKEKDQSASITQPFKLIQSSGGATIYEAQSSQLIVRIIHNMGQPIADNNSFIGKTYPTKFWNSPPPSFYRVEVAQKLDDRYVSYLAAKGLSDDPGYGLTEDFKDLHISTESQLFEYMTKKSTELWSKQNVAQVHCGSKN